jgi:hypothetical protein
VSRLQAQLSCVEEAKPVKFRHGSAAVTGLRARSQTGFDAYHQAGRFIPEETQMATIHPPVGASIPVPLPRTRVAVLLGLTVLAALILYYFVGVDEGMTSVFGKTLAVHEWVHDARHFLGFPCH